MTDFIPPFHRPPPSQRERRPSPPSLKSTLTCPSGAKLCRYPRYARNPTPTQNPTAKENTGLQTHGVSKTSSPGRGLGILSSSGPVCLFTCSRRPPPSPPSRFHLARLRGPRRTHLGGGAGFRGRREGSRLSAPQTRRCPAPPAPLTRATRPPLRSSPLPPNLPLPPPPVHWPHAGRVTPAPRPIHRGLLALIPPHPPADCQPIRREPRRGSPKPSRLSQ